MWAFFVIIYQNENRCKYGQCTKELLLIPVVGVQYIFNRSQEKFILRIFVVNVWSCLNHLCALELRLNGGYDNQEAVRFISLLFRPPLFECGHLNGCSLPLSLDAVNSDAHHWDRWQRIFGCRVLLVYLTFFMRDFNFIRKTGHTWPNAACFEIMQIMSLRLLWHPWIRKFWQCLLRKAVSIHAELV